MAGAEETAVVCTTDGLAAVLRLGALVEFGEKGFGLGCENERRIAALDIAARVAATEVCYNHGEVALEAAGLNDVV